MEKDRLFLIFGLIAMWMGLFPPFIVIRIYEPSNFFGDLLVLLMIILLIVSIFLFIVSNRLTDKKDVTLYTMGFISTDLGLICLFIAGRWTKPDTIPQWLIVIMGVIFLLIFLVLIVKGAIIEAKKQSEEIKK